MSISKHVSGALFRPEARMEVGILLGKLSLIDLVCRRHMDRHDRPYKCDTSGCKIQQGFTNSFSLLRHQREVHKLQTITRVFCPIDNCKRSAGSGFTRKQNRDEHVRRLHGMETDSVIHFPARDTNCGKVDSLLYGERKTREGGNNSIDTGSLSSVKNPGS
jgi:hypothetical protein